MIEEEYGNDCEQTHLGYHATEISDQGRWTQMLADIHHRSTE